MGNIQLGFRFQFLPFLLLRGSGAPKLFLKQEEECVALKELSRWWWQLF